ncbi:MAG: transposase, partial [Succinivibrio sp.]|nr:transposase [Succinivibrio sp.]
MSNKDKSKVDSIKDANQPKTLEEALALIAKMQATIDAQKQKENESAQGTVETVQSLRAALNQKDEELKQKDHELDIALTDNKKLIANQKNIKTLIKNLKTDLKELPKYAEALILKDENLNNIHDIQSLYDFTYELVLTLISNVKEKIRHREKALNLGTTEANSAKSIANKEDDIKAHEDGEEEFKKLVEASDIQEDEDKKEIEESSREFTSAPKKDNSKAPSTSVLDDIKNKDLKDGNDALAVLTPILEDTAKARYNNEGVVRPKAKTTYTQSHDDKIVAVTSIDTKTKYECYCPYCKKVQPFKIEAKLDRVNKVLHANSVGEITSILKSVHNATCTCCGETIQINPAAQMDFNVHKPLVPIHSNENSLRQDRNDLDTEKTASTSHLSDNQSNDRNDTETSLGQQRYINKLVQKERKDNYQKIKNSPSSGITTFDVENIMVTLKNGVKIINPWLLDNELFSFSNAFSKSSLSVGLITALGIQFAQLGVPKNRTADYFQDHGMKMSTQNLIGTTNAFARAYLHPVCKVILKHIIQNNVCVAMDESTLLVRETAKKKMAQGKGRKSQIWNISTPWTAKDQAAWFTVSSGRGHENVVDILKNASPDLKFLLTDGYSGYSSATKAIRELFGLDVDNCRCHTHARRPVHYELKARGLLKVYNTYLVPNCNFTSFAKNLKDYIEKTKNPKDKKLRKLTEKDV